jgi:hypothetical protein
VFAVAGIGAARVPSNAPESLCIPLLMTCNTPTPTPTSTPTPGGGSSGSGGLLGGLGGLLGGNSAPGGIPVIPLLATPDPDAPTMTLPAAQLGGSSLSFTGLQGVSLVTVGLANGDRTTVIRLAADSITITDFTLDVRATATSPGLVSTATKMTLRGNVVAYVNSVSATLLGGLGSPDRLTRRFIRLILEYGYTADVAQALSRESEQVSILANQNREFS